MVRTKNDFAAAKLRVLDIITKDPKISYTQLGKLTGLDRKTAKKYKNELTASVNVASERIAVEIEEKTKGDGSFWLLVKKFMKIK